MSSDYELKQIIEDLGLRRKEVADLLGVTPRAVNHWINNTRTVPGPAIAYMRLLRSVSREAFAVEVARLRNVKH
jgi:DNA-binding transcriptional regulator YiaG